MKHDVFICHASEDKDDFVRPLAEALRAQHLDVWYDEFTLTVGDSLREAIDRGLAESQFGIVVLSPSFLQKRWPQRELNGLTAREIEEGRRVVLPIWHKIGRAGVLRYSPPLADVVAVSSTRGISAVVAELIKKLRPEPSPLVIARELLTQEGIETPIITDEWWLSIVEIQESYRYPDWNHGQRWVFPLPYPDAEPGIERGKNIAMTALQLDWSRDGEDRKLGHLSHPEELHQYIRQWPGLLDCCRANPEIIALYAPQLTIPGFDDGLGDVFDTLMGSGGYAMPGYGGRAKTLDGQEPLCGELIAWRHPIFGNYMPEELSTKFVDAHDGVYSRGLFDGFECLVWLLCDASNWMPKRLRDTLLQGMRESTHGWAKETDDLLQALYGRTRKSFRFTRKVRADILEQVGKALKSIEVPENPAVIAERFISGGFVDGFFDEQDKWAQMRKRKAAK